MTTTLASLYQLTLKFKKYARVASSKSSGNSFFEVLFSILELSILGISKDIPMDSVSCCLFIQLYKITNSQGRFGKQRVRIQ